MIEDRKGSAGASLAWIYGLILLSTVFWGGTPVAGKLAIRDIPPMTVGVLRYGLASLILMVVFSRKLAPWRTLTRWDLWVLLGVGILGTFLNHILFFLGLLFAPAFHGAIIPPTTSPIWTMLLAARLGHERITRAQIGGTILCIVGVLLVARPDRLASGRDVMVLLGDVFFLLGGMAWGIYSYLSKVAMQRLTAVVTLAYGTAIGCVLLIPLAAMERPWRSLPGASGLAWVSILYITVASTVLAFFWWNIAIQRVGAGQTAVFTNLVPVFGVLLSWWVLGERLTAIQLLGGLMTVGGVWVCQGRAATQAVWRQAVVRLRGRELAKRE